VSFYSLCVFITPRVARTYTRLPHVRAHAHTCAYKLRARANYRFFWISVQLTIMLCSTYVPAPARYVTRIAFTPPCPHRISINVTNRPSINRTIIFIDYTAPTLIVVPNHLPRARYGTWKHRRSSVTNSLLLTFLYSSPFFSFFQDTLRSCSS